MQVYIEDYRNLAPPKGRKPWWDILDKSFKARNLDLYYRNSYIEYYYFYQQYKDYFETAEAKSHKHVPFIAFSLKNRIFFCWQQHKNRIKYNKVTFPSWKEFKAFLLKSLGKSTTFIDNIRSKNQKRLPVLVRRSLGLGGLFWTPPVNINRVWCWLCPIRSLFRLIFLWGSQVINPIMDQ